MNGSGAEAREYTEDDFRRDGRWCDPGGQVQRRNARPRPAPRFTHHSVNGELVRVFSAGERT